MSQEDAEDRLIRRLIVWTVTAAVAGFLALAVVITIMVSANFNILEWME